MLGDSAGPDLQGMNTRLNLEDQDPSLERLFSSHPRLVPFSHRPLCSLRHPYTRHCALEAGTPRRAKSRGHSLGGAGGAASSVGPQQDAASFAGRLRFRQPAAAQAEEKKWTELAHLADLVSAEGEVAARRVGILRSSAFLRAVDELWQAAVAGVTMTKAEHTDVTCAAWRLFAGCYMEPGSDFFTIMMRGSELDWVVDSGGAARLAYGEFAVSVLELADNWTSVQTDAAYAGTVARLTEALAAAKALQRAVPKEREGEEREEEAALARAPAPPPCTWTQKKEAIQRLHNKGGFDFLQPCVARVRLPEGSDLGEYYLERVAEE